MVKVFSKIKQFFIRIVGKRFFVSDKSRKRMLIESLIRQSYGQSGMTQSWLMSHPEDHSVDFLENDLQSFINKYRDTIESLL